MGRYTTSADGNVFMRMSMIDGPIEDGNGSGKQFPQIYAFRLVNDEHLSRCTSCLSHFHMFPIETKGPPRISWCINPCILVCYIPHSSTQLFSPSFHCASTSLYFATMGGLVFPKHLPAYPIESPGSFQRRQVNLGLLPGAQAENIEVPSWHTFRHLFWGVVCLCL